MHMHHTMTRFPNGIINVMLAAHISIIKVVLDSDKLLEMAILFFYFFISQNSYNLIKLEVMGPMGPLVTHWYVLFI